MLMLVAVVTPSHVVGTALIPPGAQDRCVGQVQRSLPATGWGLGVLGPHRT